ncbi:BrnT family toxin [Salmonella enterica]|uniref:BrnT family toxin n=2 Tax=Salmonella enterica I TaxID=59201 RepID=A0A7Z1TIF5_SALET|nr:BrnT family toxin [Salmonella enterica]EBK1958523.1 BrnT family toxin [Salmonella enterica subsp. enterica serovar Newport]EBW8396503.1 BrnT family toxin [Salmonella enterica subsp. enterica serovar Florida]EDM8205237.1 BrnT family toxin [Salmonella enterica subsp. enterica serovar Typhimurium]EDQ6274735.1 BrnT family toxin [Salmonella enterica subsp. enterica serovar Thompson]EDR6626104.1 BrnT family toxin [Salmonella enterica subsp. diarizonae]EEI8826457.1 BrnT family toxin [Salmonella e
MEIDYDNNKRNRTFNERGLDFARAGEVFAGKHFTAEDVRQDYGEIRYITAGTLDGRVVVLVWTPRDNARRIISMRKANEREKTRFKKYLE